MCLDLCKSITTNGKSTGSSHPAGGAGSCAIRGQQGRGHQMSVKARVESDTGGNSK